MASARFFAPARPFARSKPELMLRWAISMTLWFRAVAPWPSASRDLSSVSSPASRASLVLISLARLSYVLLRQGTQSLRDGGVESQVLELGGSLAVCLARLLSSDLGVERLVHGRPLGVKSQGSHSLEDWALGDTLFGVISAAGLPGPTLEQAK